ncbi:MAG: ATP-binding protein [Bacteroidales bacterium]
MVEKRKYIEGKPAQEQQALLREALDHLPHMIFVRDHQNRYLMVNDAMAAFLGLPAQRIIGHKDVDLADDRRQALENHQDDLKVMARGYSQEQDGLVLVMAGGQQKIFHSLKIPLPHAASAPGAVLGILTDVTAQKQKEKQLIDSRNQALKASSEKALMLSVMSHEIRTPLNSILGMVRLLQSTVTDQETAQNLDVLNFSAENLLSLVDDILTLSKIEEKKIAFEELPFNLRHYLKRFIRSMTPRAQEKDLKLMTHIHDRIPQWVKGDPLRLGQILNNLLGNALKFTHSGSVTLSVSLQEHSGPTLWISFSVKDTGIGIDPRKKNAIFEPFTQENIETTRQYGGTGLGLFITRQLIEAQGGTIMVNSAPGKGSEFLFSLPFQKSASPCHPAGESPDDGHRQKARVLMVEDDAMSIVLAKKIFSRKNLDPDIAETGSIALEKLCSKSYELILLDLQMPDMNGFQIMKQLKDPERSLNAHTPVVAFTASAEPEIHEQIYRAGMADVVVKPYQPEKLLKVIQRYTGKGYSSGPDETHFARLERSLPAKKDELSQLVRKLEGFAEVLNHPGQMPEADPYKVINEQMIPLYQSLGLEKETEKIQENLRLLNSFTGKNREFLFKALRGDLLKPVTQLLKLARRAQPETET